MNRRTFLASSAALAALTPLVGQAAEKKKKSAAAAAPAPARPTRSTPRPNKKGLMLNTFAGPTANKLSLMEKFKMLREAGFHGVEVQSGRPQSEVLEARDAAQLEIPSVVMATHWTHPLSDPNPTARQVSVDGLKQALRDAKAYGASSVLLVPAVVKKDVPYGVAYERSVAEIKKCVPLAEELGVAIAIENVWNEFLLSPLEAVRYVDDFRSPMVRWHLDIGNLVNIGYPEHWVRSLGARIAKIHVKEYSRKIRNEQGRNLGWNVELMEGDSDWPAVMAALDEVNYTGWLISEQRRPESVTTDAEFLSHISKKMDQILVA
jgi:L-ribulose-5-phosphate 3-epimerase